MSKNFSVIVGGVVVVMVAIFLFMKSDHVSSPVHDVSLNDSCTMSTAVESVNDQGWGYITLCQKHSDGTTTERKLSVPVTFFPLSFDIESTSDYNSAVFLGGVWKLTSGESTQFVYYIVEEGVLVTNYPNQSGVDDLGFIDTNLKTSQLFSLGELDMQSLTYSAEQEYRISNQRGEEFHITSYSSPGEGMSFELVK